MTRITHLLTALLTIGLAAGLFAEELAVGSTMPMADYEMANVDDKSVTLAGIKGENGIVVAFWCNHCPYVKRWRARFVELAADYQQKGFGFVAVNPNDPKKSPGDSMDAMKKEAKEHNFGFPYVIDDGSKLAKQFGATHTPHIFVFDKTDKLVYVGAIDDNSADANKVEERWLKDALDALAANEAVKVQRKPSIGCTIKWYN